MTWIAYLKAFNFASAALRLVLAALTARLRALEGVDAVECVGTQ